MYDMGISGRKSIMSRPGPYFNETKFWNALEEIVKDGHVFHVKDYEDSPEQKIEYKHLLDFFITDAEVQRLNLRT